jgi:hypothetical protein
MVLDQSTQPSSSPSSSSDHHKGSQEDDDEEAGKRYDYLDGFREAYLKEFGFLLDRSIPVICDDVRVRGIGKSTFVLLLFFPQTLLFFFSFCI